MSEGETKHTAGPLTIHGPSSGRHRDDDGGDYAIRDTHGFTIGEACHRVGTDEYRDAHANAQLWAAAPDLLAACEAGDVAACAWSEYMFSREIPSNEEETRRLYQAWMLARVKANHARKVAIAKALGES